MVTLKKITYCLNKNVMIKIKITFVVNYSYVQPEQSKGNLLS